MTQRKHLKQLVRARMEKTGEGYASARRQIIAQSQPEATPARFPWHFPGNVPGAAALRILLAHAGVRAPHTGQPFSEAMTFGLAGGIGIGVCSFFYEKEGVATFFIAGRHHWHDDKAYLQDACARLGVVTVVQETGGGKAADKQLRTALAEHGPSVAWVDAASLPHRSMPQKWTGGGYHVVVVHEIDDTAGTATISDLTNEPIAVPLADLAAARARIKKQKNRVLSVASAGTSPPLATIVRDAVKACLSGLEGEGFPKFMQRSFSLEALGNLADRLQGSKDKESWERVFTPGPRLWTGLVSLYDFSEHYGTGGGLCRPLFGEFFAEAGAAINAPNLKALAGRYRELGEQWSGLADAALPDDVPMLAEAKRLHAHKAELLHSGASPEDLRAVWQKIEALENRAREKFPLSAAECDELRASLQKRMRTLYDGEFAARDAMQRAAKI